MSVFAVAHVADGLAKSFVMRHQVEADKQTAKKRLASSLANFNGNVGACEHQEPFSDALNP